MTTTTGTAPTAVSTSVALWFTAIGCGVAETLVRFATPEPPGPIALAVRFAIYLGLAVLVLGLYSGRDAARWAVALLMGLLGTASLVVEPLRWLAAGGAVPEFLAAADGPTIVIVVLRAVHVLAVLAALAAMFRPAADRWFGR
ncbi:hypothetical protein GCM10010472_29760 [Pseudonocardia halophobica]|uniref:Uncharacterized protein n=1 Tax=Pseudonocardia halophobica TaxID=29401 RepID=A0A9W6NTF4_9PSEU|nr:hypothetical protein [Pseudonocardia halophobica]GLL09235.1 hypothetical protein GCM10017577_03750 [Pseudonocardia halophobica]